jgi:hypothetical protein
MTPYSGPATITTPDGTTTHVTANLAGRTGPGVAQWYGTLQTPGRALLNLHEGRLLLPDGRESGFVRTTGGAPGGPIRVEGSSGEELL